MCDEAIVKIVSEIVTGLVGLFALYVLYKLGKD
jgi:hypothetical protein